MTPKPDRHAPGRSHPEGTSAPRIAGRSRRQVHPEFRRGAVAMLPLALGYVPFALLLGAAIARSGQPLAAWSVTGLIYGGSAHLTVIQLLNTGSGPWAAAGAALLINVRLLVYSSALIPLWASAPLRIRLLAAAAMIDPSWMLATGRARLGGEIADQRRHFVGAAVVLALTWTTMVSAGTLIGSHLGLTGIFAIGVPLCLVAIVGPHLRERGGAVAVAAAAGTAIAAASWPAGSGTLLAMAAAAAGGGLASRRLR